MIASKADKFIYKDQLWIKVTPGKRLFNSTTIHEVVNRGDIFCVRISDNLLTILPGDEEVQILTDKKSKKAAVIDLLESKKYNGIEIAALLQCSKQYVSQVATLLN